MPFLTQGPEGEPSAPYGVKKTNWKPRRNPFGILRGRYILIVVILAIIVAGFSRWALTHIFLEPWNMEERLIRVKQIKEKGEEEEVSITTDKTEYEQGDAVKSTIKNNLNQSVWYWDNRGRIIPLVGIQIFENGEWKNVGGKDACACKSNCITYAANWTELKSKETLTDSWETKEDCLGEIAKEGKYRVWFSYDLDFTGQNNPEKFSKVYSNEFIIRKKEIAGQCSPIDFVGYELVKNYNFDVDLNNDGEKETVRVYWDSKEVCDKVKTIMVKVFSGTENCPKEIFSSGWGNQVGKAEIFQNFWGDGSDVVLVEGMSYACGCGSTIRLLFLTYREGKYSIVEGPQLGGLGWMYKFNGHDGAGKKIIAAEPKWATDYSDYCCGCAHRLQFTIYTWDGGAYTKTVAGTTQNKYLLESIDEILQKEPSVLNQQ